MELFTQLLPSLSISSVSISSWSWSVEQWWYSSTTASSPTTSGSSSRVCTSSLYWWRPSSPRSGTSTGTSSLAGVRCGTRRALRSFVVGARVGDGSVSHRDAHRVCDHLGSAPAALRWLRVGFPSSPYDWWLVCILNMNAHAPSGVGTWMTTLPSGGWSRDQCWLR